MINLLIVNLSKQHTSLVIKTLRNKDLETDHIRITDLEKIDQDLIDNNFWDAVILSEDTSKDFVLLQSATDQFNDTPIIFFAEQHNDQIFNNVLKNGAQDCISASDIYRLPTILQYCASPKQRSLDQWELVHSSKVFSQITNSSNEEIFLFDARTLKCCFANNSAISKLGYPASEFKKFTADKIYSEYNRETFSTLLEALQKNKRKKISLCTNISRKKGIVYPTEVIFKKLKVNNRSYILALNKDISNTRYKVRKLKRQRKLTRKFVNKHRQKEELLANAAHDMRTSLQSIVLSNKLLFQKQSGDFKQGYRKFQKAIHFSGKHLLNYINEFFDPSNQNGHRSILMDDSIDIKSFANKLYLVFKPIAQRNDIEFKFNHSSLAIDYISTNQTYIKRILKNLLSNAFKFTNKGRVTFEVSSSPAEEVSNAQIETDHIISFKVSDTGIGIPDDQQKKIFKRHRRTTNAQKGSGTGLGLNICKKLTDALEGTLTVESKVGQGSTFELFIPAYKKNLPQNSSIAHKQNGQSKTAKKIENKKKSILVVDDSEVHNMAIKEYLSHNFDQCLTADTIPKAQNILTKKNIDCIVADYIIYENNSLNFIQQLNRQDKYSSIPTIVYTGKKLQHQEHQHILSHADAIVKKNAGSYEKLVNTIFTCLKQNGKKSDS
jgi:PAS domain S-box-containing protein